MKQPARDITFKRTVAAAVSSFFKHQRFVEFHGTGLNDTTFAGTITASRFYMVLFKISTAAATDKFQYSLDGGGSWSAEVSMTGSPQTIVDGLTVDFAATTGHTLADQWTVELFAVPSARMTTPAQTGSGLSDVAVAGTYTGGSYLDVRVKISTAAATDKFQYSLDGGANYSAEVSMSGSAQAIGQGITVDFTATTGHTLADYWDFKAIPPLGGLLIHDILVEVDTAEATDEIAFLSTGGTVPIWDVSVATAGNFTHSWATPVELPLGEDVQITTTGSTFSALVTIHASVYLN